MLLKKARRKGFRGCIQSVVAGSWQCRMRGMRNAPTSFVVELGQMLPPYNDVGCSLFSLVAVVCCCLLSAVSGARKRREPRLQTSDLHA